MKHLQDLNPQKNTATNAMALFLALNTTHLTLVPAKTIAVRLEYGSTQATNIVLPTILATACGMITAVVVAKLLQRRFPVDAAPGAPTAPPPTEPSTTAPVVHGDGDQNGGA
jgi:spore maturation protein SpmA